MIQTKYLISMSIRLQFNESYDLPHTFDCGQTFRFTTYDSGRTYYGPIGNRILKIKSLDSNTLQVSSNFDTNLEIFCRSFFRLEDDYHAMQKRVAIDDLMTKIVETTNGLHVVRQDRFECVLSFILSQCSNIPRITKNINSIAEKYGTKVHWEGHDFYLFPELSLLKNVSEEIYREMGFGYRAKYIAKLIQNWPSFLDTPPQDSNEFNKKLQSIEGIGQKVADCIQLFAYGDMKWFPVDTWMNKFMHKYYSQGQKQTEKQLRLLGQSMFGEWAGYAQELIFRYARCYDTLI
jgi:N-glycosylase/DNA lyase